ncbi:MAG TPA: nitroreductase family protein [Streptosporangiaceae bacterium]|jgi:SagB-type dehydrogenase family enzyme
MAGNRALPGGAVGPVAGAALAGGGTIDAGTYVRLCREHAVVTDEDSLIVVGGRQRQRLTGAAGELIPRLLPLLDGGRKVADIAGLLGMGAAELARALSVLREAGLVEHGGAPLNAVCRDAPEHAAAFLSRVVHATSRYRNSQEQSEALSASAVLVVGHGPVADAVRADLRCCGAGRVIGWEPDNLAAIAAAVQELSGAARPLVVLAGDDPAGSMLGAAETACRRYGVPLLRGARQAASIEVGPLFYRDHTACASCWSRGRAGLPEAGTGASAEHAGLGGIAEMAADQVLAAMLADEAVAAIGCVRAVSSLGTVLIASLTGATEQKLLALPYPDCTRCGDLLASSDPADAAAAYEWSVQHPPSGLMPPSPETASYRRFLAELATQRPSFLPGPSYSLPAAAMADGGGGDGPAGSRLGMPALATLLARVAGRRAPADPADLSRWAPTGGNLASVRLYLAASGEGFGAVAGKLTTYDDLTHRLLAVRARPADAALLLAGTGLRPRQHCLVLVFAADVARIGRKYGSFGYRLAHLDAGVAAAQLTVVASQLGLRVDFAPDWDSGLPAVLELRPDDEIPTAVALVTEEESADGPDD